MGESRTTMDEAYRDDYQLIQGVERGDAIAYRMLLEKYLHVGLRTAQRMLGNRQDAEDVMQEVFFKLWNGATKWTPDAKFSTWLYRVVFNACIDRKRKVLPLAPAVLEEVEDHTPGADEVLMQRQRAIQIQQALQALPERQRMAILLCYYENMSNKEAASVLAMSLGAFQQLLFRARQQLRKTLGLQGEEEETWNAMKN